MRTGKHAARAAVFVAALAMAPACAAQTGVTIAGGALDPAFPGADVYVGTPQSATPPHGRACEAARRYVELVNAGAFSSVGDMYEEDGVLLEPTRHTYIGRASIREFYQTRIGAITPSLIAVAYTGDDVDCMVALANLTAIGGQQRYVLVSVDHFTMGPNGGIARMVAFGRPPRRE